MVRRVTAKTGTTRAWRAYRRVDVAIVGVFVLAASAVAVSPAAATGSTVVVNPGDQFQTVQGWGSSLSWWSEVAGTWPSATRSALAAALYNNATPTTSDLFSETSVTPPGLGLNVARYAVGSTTAGDACSSYIGNHTNGTLRNNFTGNVGMEFTAASSGLLSGGDTVSAIGREFVAGNSGTHTLTITNVSSGAGVATASLNTTTAGVDSNGFQWAALSSPVTLSPGTAYYVTSSEANGGDYWYDGNTTVSMDWGTVDGSAYFDSSNTWHANTDAGTSYGPVNLEFTAPGSEFHPGANIPSLQQTSGGTASLTNDPNQEKWMTLAKANGANLFEGVSYSAPDFMTTNGCSAGADGQGSLATNLNSSEFSSYAQYVANAASLFQATDTPLRSVDAFNEPNATDWSKSLCNNANSPLGCQQGENVSPADQGTIIKDLKTDLTAGAVPVNIAANDEEGVATEATDAATWDSTTRADVTQTNTHDYLGGSGAALAAATTAAGQQVSMSEWGSDGGWAKGDTTSVFPADKTTSALDLSNEILRVENQLHPSTFSMWQAIDGWGDNGTSADLWGLAYASSATNPTITYPERYYAMGNYSKFVRPGYTIIGNTSSASDTLTAYDPSTSTLVIVATNAGTSATTPTFDLSQFSGSLSETAYQTSSTEDLKNLGAATIATGNQLAVSLPAQSITTYVVAGASYSGSAAATQVDDGVITTSNAQNEFDYTGTWTHCSGDATCGTTPGYYNHSDSWSNTANDTATVKFTGPGIDLYGITDTNEGRATVSVDGGPQTEVDFYSATRKGNQLMWASPVLSAGAHTITITVEHVKDPSSTDYYIGLDRAEIAAAPTDGSLAQSKTTGTLRNNFTGQVGMKFTTGTTGLTVTALGREYVPGNSGIHGLAITTTGGTVVASANLDTTVTTNTPDAFGYQYVTLPTSVTLTANTSYYLTSAETSGGDYWYDLDSNTTLTNGYTVNGPEYNNGTWAGWTAANQTYGPLNLITH